MSNPKLYDHEAAYKRIRDAAPDLLEALDALVLDLDNNKGRRISLEAARVAIAKAKGEK